MVRRAQAEVFAPDLVAVVRVMNRAVRCCYLLDDDPVTGKNDDHHKVMIEKKNSQTILSSSSYSQRLGSKKTNINWVSPHSPWDRTQKRKKSLESSDFLSCVREPNFNSTDAQPQNDVAEWHRLPNPFCRLFIIQTRLVLGPFRSRRYRLAR